VPFGPKRTAGISGHCSEAHCSKAWSIGPRRVGPRHGDLVQGMGRLVRGMGCFGLRLGAEMAHGIGSE